jgi:hypothetical protein
MVWITSWSNNDGSQRSGRGAVGRVPCDAALQSCARWLLSPHWTSRGSISSLPSRSCNSSCIATGSTKRQPAACCDRRPSLAQRHVLDHAVTQRGDGIHVHGKLLSWMRLTTPRSSRTGRPCCYRRSLSREFLSPRAREAQILWFVASQGFLRRFHRRMCTTGVARRALTGKGMRCARRGRGRFVQTMEHGAGSLGAARGDRPIKAVPSLGRLAVAGQ